VLRFLGQSEKVRGKCQYEIKSSLKARPEGLRVKRVTCRAVSCEREWFSLGLFRGE